MAKKPPIPAPIFGADALLDRLRPALAADLNLRQTALLLHVAAAKRRWADPAYREARRKP